MQSVLSVMAHVCKISPQKAKVEGSRVQSQEFKAWAMQCRAISETNMEMFVIIYEEGGRREGGREGIKMR